MQHASIKPETLPELPATHDFLCACCNTVRTLTVCPESNEIAPVYAWERGCPPVYARGSWFDGHAPDIQDLEDEANTLCVRPTVFVGRIPLVLTECVGNGVLL